MLMNTPLPETIGKVSPKKTISPNIQANSIGENNAR
jgi:hypothetical protein